MKVRWLIFAPWSFLLLLTFAASQASASSPGFSVTVEDVTLASSGIGSTQYTVHSIDSYTGKVVVECEYPGKDPSILFPSCADFPPPNSPLVAHPIAANQTIRGKVEFKPYQSYARNQRPAFGIPGGGFALAGALCCAFVRRRDRRRTLFLSLCALCLFAGLGACGAGSPRMTPGTYVYTATAIDGTTDAFTTTQFKVTIH